MRFLLPAFLLFLLLGCIIDQNYRNPSKGISTIQPAGWTAQDDWMGTSFISPDGAQISIIAVYSNSTDSPEKIASLYASRALLQKSNIKIIKNSSISLNVSGIPASESTIYFSYGSGRTMEYLIRVCSFRNGDEFFIISLNAEMEKISPEYEKAYEKVLSNFRVI